MCGGDIHLQQQHKLIAAKRYFFVIPMDWIFYRSHYLPLQSLDTLLYLTFISFLCVWRFSYMYVHYFIFDFFLLSVSVFLLRSLCLSLNSIVGVCVLPDAREHTVSINQLSESMDIGRECSNAILLLQLCWWGSFGIGIDQFMFRLDALVVVLNNFPPIAFIGCLLFWSCLFLDTPPFRP